MNTVWLVRYTHDEEGHLIAVFANQEEARAHALRVIETRRIHWKFIPPDLSREQLLDIEGLWGSFTRGNEEIWVEEKTIGQGIQEI